MANLVKKWRLFMSWDYKKEEEFLRTMHSKGLSLVSTTKLGTYSFKKTDPSDMNYKLAYKEIKGEVDKKDYIQMYEDEGWEYIQEVNNFYYFRSAEKEDQSLIKSETRDRILRNSFSDLLIPLIVLFAVIYLPTLSEALGRLGDKSSDFIRGFADGARTGITLIYTAGFVYVLASYLKAKNSKE